MGKYHQKFTAEESSVIREVKYNPRREVIEVRIEQQSGEERVYFYEDVPEELYFDFLAADSKGRFYNNNIKGEYTVFES